MSAIIPIADRVLGPVARAGGRAAQRINVSFEFFPPKSEEAEESLWRCVQRLAPLQPKFVSVTYGAGGSTRERTHRTILRLLKEPNLSPAAHLTCVEARREQVDEIIQEYWDAGVRHIVALRGDPPGGVGGSYAPGPEQYANATELTAAITRIAPFEVSVGLYPEKHPESPSLDHDIDVLKAKVDAGATRAITQFFFDVDAFLRFADRVRAAGVTIPILPGIMPVTNYKGLVRMAGRWARGCPRGWPTCSTAGRRSGDAAADRRRGGLGDVRAAGGGGVHRAALLHAEPRRPGLRICRVLACASPSWRRPREPRPSHRRPARGRPASASWCWTAPGRDDPAAQAVGGGLPRRALRQPRPPAAGRQRPAVPDAAGRHRELHDAYFAAGADFASTNTFNATASARPTTGSRAR
jgi:methylenetetrahydrofolate reductase (NADPH)